MAGNVRPRVAIAHDYLTQRGGAERVVLAMTRAFPTAPLYTLLYEPHETLEEFQQIDVRPSILNRVGPIRRNHRMALPILPLAAESMNIDADVVLASSSGWAHGIRTGGKKLVYCYSPARWLYQSDSYLGADAPRISTIGLRATTPYLKRWDKRAAGTVDKYLAISTAVKDRIESTYGLDSEVVPAPVTIDRTAPSRLTDEEAARDLESSPFYLVISRLLPYKNVDKVVRAFEGLPSKRLVVVGTGPQLSNLRGLAGTNVTFLSNLNDGEMQWLYSKCVAVVAASFEDYGLTPIEAALHGRPSIVLRWGGFLDTMVEGTTACFFDEPAPDQITAAIRQSDEQDWDAERIRQHAETFSESSFAEELHRQVSRLLRLTDHP